MKSSVDELKENLRKADENRKSKESTISSLQEEVSRLQKSVETSSETSKNELQKLSEELERSKEQEKVLRSELEVCVSSVVEKWNFVILWESLLIANAGPTHTLPPPPQKKMWGQGPPASDAPVLHKRVCVRQCPCQSLCQC